MCHSIYEVRPSMLVGETEDRLKNVKMVNTPKQQWTWASLAVRVKGWRLLSPRLPPEREVVRRCI